MFSSDCVGSSSRNFDPKGLGKAVGSRFKPNGEEKRRVRAYSLIYLSLLAIIIFERKAMA
jgi:hypothetical protein